jgi:hypothetical protein
MNTVLPLLAVVLATIDPLQRPDRYNDAIEKNKSFLL